MAKKRTKSCRCVEQVNAQLVEHNARIETLFVMGNSHINESPPVLKLEKLDTRKRKEPPPVLCSFCPFCGKKYPSAD